HLMDTQSDDVEYSLENYQASNLDLAQVYIEMEDFESATDVLQEVMKSGSEEQKSEAKLLLKDIEKA
ncbi:MAG: FimV/HubP family polar landmark protein, partial [Pseudomonadota bacterium]